MKMLILRVRLHARNILIRWCDLLKNRLILPTFPQKRVKTFTIVKVCKKEPFSPTLRQKICTVQENVVDLHHSLYVRIYTRTKKKEINT